MAESGQGLRIRTSTILKSRIDDLLAKRELEERHRPGRRVIHPSSISACIREIVLSILGYASTEKTDGKTVRVFDAGKSMHERFQKYLKELGHADIEVFVKSEDLWLEGMIDAIVRINGERYIVELKSSNSYVFNSIQTPHRDYIEQVHAYMLCTGIDKAIILYENKDTQDIKEFIVERDQEVIDKIVEKIKLVQSYVERNEIPPMTCKSKSDARYCSYKGFCFNDKTVAKSGSVRVVVSQEADTK